MSRMKSPELDKSGDIWRKAMDHMLIVNHIGTADGCESVQDCLDKIKELINFEVTAATDPACNGGYKLMYVGDEEWDEVNEFIDRSSKEIIADIDKTFMEQQHNKNMKIKVKAELDDAAFDCGNFIQKTLSLLDDEFDKFYDNYNHMIEGMDEEQKRDWLFDYIWNGWNDKEKRYDEMFSESLSNINGFDVE